jgi:hypothetical protein
MDSAFKEQMKWKKWQYLDIVPKTAVVKLVATRELHRDLSMKYLGVNKLTETQVWDLLIDVVDRLETSETYHIGLLDDISDPADGEVQLLKQFITQHFWTAKPGMEGKLNLIMTEWPVNELGTRREVHYHIDDFDITKAFISILGGFWRSMPAKKLEMDKDEVTKFINTQRRKLPKPNRK